jgi:N-acetylmuramoyl-L-alanine amidase
VRRLLVGAGLKVNLTRTTDSFVALPDRPELAKRRDADLFVSLHFNSAIAEKSHVNGVEVYCMTPAGVSSTNARGEGAETSASRGNIFDAKNMLLAYHIQKTMASNLGAEDRGVRRARFAVLRNAEMPAVLVEAGFMSHPQESKKIFDSEYRRRLAQAIADGILAYKRLVERPD